jgi:3-oxoacyl-[acyl-carrier protein] reductase
MATDKYALVTGGSRGIGRAICLRLADMGYHVLINYRSNQAEAETTQSLIQDQNGKASLLPFDVGNPKEAESVLTKWQDDNKEALIEVLINNAGIRKDNLLLWMKEDEWHDVLRTNLDSFFYITRLILKPMVVNKYGRIVNIVSLSGQKGLAGQTNYSASKAGLIAATKSLAQEVGRRNITVNAVAPGFIRTEMTEGIEEKDYKELIPVNRFGTPEEVADAVAFLASSKASYITGEVLSVNGGMYT